MSKESIFTKDVENRKLTIVRPFAASLDRVWDAWSNSEELDKWWAPRPYRAETQSFDFREGGAWIYCMIGPNGDTSWCREDYKRIVPRRQIDNSVGFCDESGKTNTDFPTMHWNKNFAGNEQETTVTVVITFDQDVDMETIIKMGFEEGFKMGLNNLEEYLQS